MNLYQLKFIPSLAGINSKPGIGTEFVGCIYRKISSNGHVAGKENFAGAVALFTGYNVHFGVTVRALAIVIA